jgi:signal transduction histidine kinase
MTFQLHPSMLDQLGLTETLQHYADLLSKQTKAQIRIADFGPPMTLPAPVTSFLFRAVKELITNALKHGPAIDILVQIRRQPGDIRIVVNDDGKGFTLAADSDAKRTGLGLAWIRERLRSLGGSLDIESSPGQGARVTINLPVKSTAPEPGAPAHGEPYSG